MLNPQRANLKNCIRKRGMRRRFIKTATLVANRPETMEKNDTRDTHTFSDFLSLEVIQVNLSFVNIFW